MVQIPDLVAYLKGYGGYFRRFRGGALQQWAVPEPSARNTLI